MEKLIRSGQNPYRKMASIRKTKKAIKKNPWGPLWVKHAKYWVVDAVNPTNEYRGISRFFYDVDVRELSRITNITENKIKKYIILCL